MQITVVGGVEISVDDGAVDLQRGLMKGAIFALVYAERSLTKGELKELLWENDHVSDRQVITLMSRLKERLGDRLVSDGVGYRLDIAEDDYVDLRVSRALIDEAERVSANDPYQAVLLYQYALSLWSEPLLVGLPQTPAMDTIRASLVNEHLDAVERLAELELAVGRHRELARRVRLRALLDTEPHREHLRGLVMRALVRAGRPAEARRLYEDLRDELAADGGAAPGPALRNLYQQIRDGDPALLFREPPEHPADASVRIAGGDRHHPSLVRMDAYLSGGDFNTAMDRARAAYLTTLAPQVKTLARENELYGARVVRRLAKEAGIIRVLEVGAGVPGPFSAHEVVRRVAPGARVVYTNPDASIVRHSQKVLRDAEGVSFVQADLRNPQTILECDDVQQLIGSSEPLLLMIRSAVNYIPDADNPQSMIRALTDVMAPGSRLALNIATHEGMTDLVAKQLGAVIADLEETLILRSYEDAVAMFGSLKIMDPGVTDISLVWPDRPHRPTLGPFRAFGGVAVKR